MAHSLSFFCDI